MFRGEFNSLIINIKQLITLIYLLMVKYDKMILKRIIKSIFPKKFFVVKSQIIFYLAYIYEYITYYKFNLNNFNKDYKKNKIQLKKINFVSSRGFLNYFVINPFQEESLSIYNNNNTYYIPTDAIEIFIKKYLPNIQNKFKIITGNSDLAVDYKIDKILTLLNNKYLIKMYSQNLLIRHKKLMNLPIGIDLHSRFSINRRGPGKILPKPFENIFIKTIKIKKIKKNKIYCNFHFRLNLSRKDCLKKIPKNLCVFQNKKITQAQTWREIKKYKFVACPDGNGVDTHRFWETVLLGSIPIILKTNKLISLYKKMPVIIVKDWNIINHNFLKKKYIKLKNKKFNYNILFMKYWINLIEQNKVKQNKKMTYKSFIKFI